MTRPTAGVVALVLCAALVLTISNGLRSSFGLFLTPMSLDIGFSRETFALAIAIQGLVWGISQPVFGALADRHGAVPVVLLGIVIYVVGLLWMAWVGGALGLALALAVARLLGGLLFEVDTLDPLTFVGVPLVLGAAALLAAYLPARRASRVSPVTALRTD